MASTQHPTPITLTSPSSAGTTRFLAEALRQPHQIGALAPSGPHLAGQAARLIDQHGGPQVVVELGPGGGAITDVLRARLPSGSTLAAVEINATLVTFLQHSRPWLKVIHGDAANLPLLLTDAGIPPADLIVSALPWSLIGDDAQRNILTAVATALNPHGTFATVTAVPVTPLPAIRRFLRHLNNTFGSVIRTSTVWRNMPPAYLHVCRNPAPPGPVTALAATDASPTYLAAA